MYAKPISSFRYAISFWIEISYQKFFVNFWILLQVIQARKASEQDVYSDITRNDANDLFLYDYEPYRPSSLFENYPTEDATSMSFIYDTTTFSNDSPLDFLGGSMTSYSRIGSLEGFGSVDNFSLDDFY